MCIDIQVDPPDIISTLFIRLLQITFIYQILISIGKSYFSREEGLYEFFLAFILFLAYKQLSFTLCVMYIALTLINTVYIGIKIGKRVQQGDNFRDYGDKEKQFYWALEIFSVLFYIASVTIAFKSYQ